MNTPEQQAREMMRRLGVYRWHARDYLELANLIAERDELKADLERERMRLVACGVVAMADTPESAARERNMHPDYKSAACADVARRVDECMRLRAELAAIKQGAGEPVAWSITMNGQHAGSLCDDEQEAVDLMARLDRNFPGDIRAVVPLYTRPRNQRSLT